MRPYWTVTAEEIVARFASKDEEFPQFVQDLILATDRGAAIDRATETKAADGGVDLRVGACETLGGTAFGERWIKSASVWQIKSDRVPTLSKKYLKGQIEGNGSTGATKPKRPTTSKSVAPSKKSKTVSQPSRFVVDRLKAGDLYRYCIAGSATPKSLEQARDRLKSIVPHESAPEIISPNDLARWVNRFPSLVQKYFRSATRSGLDYQNWGQRETARVKTYVPVPSRSVLQKELEVYLEWGRKNADSIFQVRGFSGVGKTRFVYESLQPSAPLVVVLDLDGALELLRALREQPEQRVIIVVDECSAEGVHRLRDEIRALEERARVIAIDNAAAATIQKTLWLEKIPSDIVEQILRSNFEELSPEQHRRYAELSKGFVRLAADICRHAPELEAPQPSTLFNTIDQYLRARFEPNKTLWDALALLSLTTLVGDSGTRRAEIEALLSFAGLKENDVHDAIRIHNQQTGFVARVGDEIYVTPEVVAQVCFEFAWKQYSFRDKGQYFVEKFPRSLLESFLRRVVRSASKEVRDQVAACFQGWFYRCLACDVAKREVAVSVELLARFDRDTYVAHLRTILEQASLDELLAIRGEYTHDGWGARRHIVSMLARAAQFEDSFDNAEVALRRLALAENEYGIGNNATGTWTDLFRLHGSGAARRFEYRLQVLESLLDSGTESEHQLLFSALEKALRQNSFEILPHYVDWEQPPVVWRTQTAEQLRLAHTAYFQLLAKAFESKNVTCRSRTVALVANHLRDILLLGGDALDFAKSILSGEIEPTLRARVNEQLGQFLSWDADRLSDTDYVQRVRQWRTNLTEGSLMSRVATVVGSLWDASNPLSTTDDAGQSAYRAAMKKLAAELIGSERSLNEVLPFLTSANAHGAFDFGAEIAAQDADWKLLDVIIRAAVSQGESSLLGRGYAYEMLNRHPEREVELNALLDELQPQHPANVLELCVVHSDRLALFRRTLRAVASGVLGINHLRRLEVLAFRGALSDDEFAEAALLARHSANRAAAHRVVVSLAHRWSTSRAKKVAVEKPSERVLDTLVDALRSALSEQQIDGDAWVASVRALSAWRFRVACDLAFEALVGNTWFLRKELSTLIASFAKESSAVVRQFGRQLEDPKLQAHFGIGHYRDLVSMLPEDELVALIKQLTVVGARHLARHLPRPFLDDAGVPVVPTITLELLTRFERDADVFEEFCVGLRSGVTRAGDIAEQYEDDAKTAEHFLDHPNRRVRAWAKREIGEARADADRWRQSELRDAIR